VVYVTCSLLWQGVAAIGLHAASVAAPQPDAAAARVAVTNIVLGCVARCVRRCASGARAQPHPQVVLDVMQSLFKA
jgi:hypothetical protein